MTTETEDNETDLPETEVTPDDESLRGQRRRAVRFFYDMQKLRIQSGARGSRKADHAEAQLSKRAKKRLDEQSELLHQLERNALWHVNDLLKNDPIAEWLLAIKGVGPTMAGVLLAEIDITRANTPSALWRFCGLHVKDGVAARRKKGEKLDYNPWLKAKVLKVLGECMIKANSPYRKLYDDYKHHKQTQIVECDHVQWTEPSSHEPDPVTKKKPVRQKKQMTAATCKLCNGTGKKAWGNSDGHRHNAALRYMVKQFLIDLWKEWRRLEKLPVVESYAEAKLGIRHGDHASSASLHAP
jgi:hypothetical protein